MKMSELIKAYGDDRVAFQNLDQCATALNMKKGETKITFGTVERLNPNGTERLGLVLWMDRERVAGIMAAHRASAALAKAEQGGE